MDGLMLHDLDPPSESNDIFSLSDQVLSDTLQFIEEIGYGNWGSVWLCRPKPAIMKDGVLRPLGQKIAVKLVHRAKTSTTASSTSGARVKSLWNEMKIVRSFKLDPHPSIIPFHSFIITPSYALITMSYLPTLVPVEVEETKARQWFRLLLSGVEFLHKRGVVHNDIKPANILLSNKNVPVLVDFGFAEKYDLQSDTAFHSNLAYGTPEYLSPERARGLPHDTRKSDVWSLGVTFFEILIGRTPFEFSDADQFTSSEDLEMYWGRTMRGKWVGSWKFTKGMEKLLQRMIAPNADLRCTVQQAFSDSYWQVGPMHKRSSSFMTTTSSLLDKKANEAIDDRLLDIDIDLGVKPGQTFLPSPRIVDSAEVLSSSLNHYPSRRGKENLRQNRADDDKDNGIAKNDHYLTPPGLDIPLANRPSDQDLRQRPLLPVPNPNAATHIPVLSKARSQPKVTAKIMNPRRRIPVPPVVDLSPIKASPNNSPLPVVSMSSRNPSTNRDTKENISANAAEVAIGNISAFNRLAASVAVTKKALAKENGGRRKNQNENQNQNQGQRDRNQNTDSFSKNNSSFNNANNFNGNVAVSLTVNTTNYNPQRKPLRALMLSPRENSPLPPHSLSKKPSGQSFGAKAVKVLGEFDDFGFSADGGERETRTQSRAPSRSRLRNRSRSRSKGRNKDKEKIQGMDMNANTSFHGRNGSVSAKDRVKEWERKKERLREMERLEEMEREGDREREEDDEQLRKGLNVNEDTEGPSGIKKETKQDEGMEEKREKMTASTLQIRIHSRTHYNSGKQHTLTHRASVKENFNANSDSRTSSPSPVLPMFKIGSPLFQVLNNVGTETPARKDPKQNTFRHSIRASLDKTMQFYKSSTLAQVASGRSTPSSGQRLSFERDVSGSGPKASTMTKDVKEAWESDSDADGRNHGANVGELPSPLPIIRNAAETERVAADARMDRMTIWMRNVEKVVEDAKQNFAASSPSTKEIPLPALPLPLSRNPSQNRISRLPRRVLAASQIFQADENGNLTPMMDQSMLSTSGSAFIMGNDLDHSRSSIPVTPGVATSPRLGLGLKVFASEDKASQNQSQSQMQIPQIFVPSRQRRATVSTRSPEPADSASPAPVVDVGSTSPSKRKEKSKSHGNLFQRPIAPISLLEAELNKPSTPEPTPRLSQVIDRNLFIAPQLTSRDDLLEKSIEHVGPSSSDDLTASPYNVEPYPPRTRTSHDSAIPDTPNRHRIEGVYDRFLMATTGVKRLGKGYQSDNTGSSGVGSGLSASTVGLGPQPLQNKRAFYSSRRPMPPPVSSDDRLRTASVDELGITHSEKKSDPISPGATSREDLGSSTISLMRKAIKLVVPKTNVSRRLSRL